MENIILKVPSTISKITNKGQFVKGHKPYSGIEKGWFKKGIKFNHSKNTKEKISLSKKGKPLSEEHKINLRIPHIGSGIYKHKLISDKHPNWKGGITPLTKVIRHSFKYRQWRSDIFTRDNFICQECFLENCYLEAHHIDKFSNIIERNKIKTLEKALNCEELWNINNGITLCNKCHNKTKNGK